MLTKFKVMVIKAIIQVVATYGGRFFGISATRCKPLQQVVDATTRTLAKCGKSAAMVRLRQELSLTDLNIKAAVTKTRTFMKWADLRTWISDLIKCPYKNICDTWHMLLECSRWQALRADILAQYIHIYTVQVATKPPLLPASISMREVKTFKYKDLQGSDCTLVKTTLKTSNFLNAIALPRYLMLNSIILASIPSNQCPPGTETQKHTRGSGEKTGTPIVNPHISTNMLATCLESYLKFTEALLTIEENFFHSLLTDKKKKKQSLVAPRVVQFSVLYNPQATLSNINKPIDLSVHQKLLNNPKKLLENDNIVFVHTIRVLLSDLATTITQLRIDTVHREINLAENPPQIPECEKRQQSTHQSYSGGGFAQAQKTQATAPTAFFAGGIAAEQKRISRFLLWVSGRKAPLPVLGSICKADKRPLSPRHCRDGIQDSVQESESKESKGFDKEKLYML
ncbi:hypothetical protein BB561_006728 [Smittium simulii]|uniref:Uncharacterized protein n=1 Tax=Smittium simulii TaxID=133385 RepID=A0A2T9Y1Z6_9FUNG|nr:hypothetical protein BB561_006728 [Smittium simulii]